jgi:branched-chain amino acid transport system permease protein
MKTPIAILASGISTGVVYGLLAFGYTLVFSMQEIINFAHGAMFTLFAYLTYLLVGGAVSSYGLLTSFQLAVPIRFWGALPLVTLPPSGSLG